MDMEKRERDILVERRVRKGLLSPFSLVPLVLKKMQLSYGIASHQGVSVGSM